MYSRTENSIRVGDELEWILEPCPESVEAVVEAPEREAFHFNDLFQSSKEASVPAFPVGEKWSIPRFFRSLREKAGGAARASSFSFPWVRAMILLAAATVLLRKDIQFSFFMEAPVAASRYVMPDETKGGLPILLPGTGPAKDPGFGFPPPDERQVNSYLVQCSGFALAEMKATGIPASLHLAMALLESRAGTTPGALHDNNHFPLLFGQSSFTSAALNWRRHSLYLQHLAEGRLPPDAGRDAWMELLQEKGYWKDPRNKRQVAETIERFNLVKFDLPAG